MRDEAIRQYTDYARSINYEETVNLALSVEDKKKRGDALKNALEFWKYHDPGAARNWLNKKSGAFLSKDQKERFLRDE